MKEYKAVQFIKRELPLREYQLFADTVINAIERRNVEHMFATSKDAGVQYNNQRDNVICTCRNSTSPKRYFSPAPKQIYVCHRSRSFTEIGVGSIKPYQKKKVKRIYLPETDDRGVGSSEILSVPSRKVKQSKVSNYKEIKTSSKCVGGAVVTKVHSLVSAKLSPIVHTKSGCTSTQALQLSQDVEIETSVVIQRLDTTTSRMATPKLSESDENDKQDSAKEGVKVSPPVEVIKASPKPMGSPNDSKIKKDRMKVEKSFSSDSLVTKVHSYDNASSLKSLEPMENERKYKKVIDVTSKVDKTDSMIKSSPVNSPSLFKKRFSALKRSLSKKQSTDTARSLSRTSVRDASVTSDPPSLEAHSSSNTTIYSNQNNALVFPKDSLKKTVRAKRSSSLNWSKASTMDSEFATGVKGMFKLWGKKFYLDDSVHNKDASHYKKESYPRKEVYERKQDSYSKKESYFSKQESYRRKDFYERKQESHIKKASYDRNVESNPKKESRIKKQESHPIKEMLDKKQEPFPKKEVQDRKQESYPKKESRDRKQEYSKTEAHDRKPETYPKKESYDKKPESYPKKESRDRKQEIHPKKSLDKKSELGNKNKAPVSFIDNKEVIEEAKAPKEPTEQEKKHKDKKRFSFFRRKKNKEKEKEKQPFNPKKGVTTGRCEVKDGLSIKIGGAGSQPAAVPEKKSQIENVPRTNLQAKNTNPDLIRAAWLLKFLATPAPSRNRVNIRWKNCKYATSSSTLFEIMEDVYKDTGVIVRSNSNTVTESSSNNREYSRHNFVQTVGAWMIPNTILDNEPPVILTRNNDEVALTMAGQKWVIEKSKAFANKIEVVLHTNNFVKLGNQVASSDYLRIDIPKGFFSDDSEKTSSDDRQVVHSSDEEVYKIVNYESKASNYVMATTAPSKVPKSKDSEPKNIEVTVSFKDCYSDKQPKILETVIKSPPMHRDVVTQGQNVYFPKTCDVIGVGIITQRDLREIEVRQPIIRVVDYLSEEESRSTENLQARRTCGFAESYLQDYYKHYQPLGMDLFSWCVSDSHLKCCSDDSYFSPNGTKSCPNIYEDYATLTSCEMLTYSQSQLQSFTVEEQREGTSKKDKKGKKFKKFKQGNKDDAPNLTTFVRILPKDSLEVFRKRKVHAIEKSRWGEEMHTYSTPSNADQGIQNNGPRKTTPKKVALPDCDAINELKQTTDLSETEKLLNPEILGTSKKNTKKGVPKNLTVKEDVSIIKDPSICTIEAEFPNAESQAKTGRPSKNSTRSVEFTLHCTGTDTKLQCRKSPRDEEDGDVKPEAEEREQLYRKSSQPIQHDSFIIDNACSQFSPVRDSYPCKEQISHHALATFTFLEKTSNCECKSSPIDSIILISTESGPDCPNAYALKDTGCSPDKDTDMKSEQKAEMKPITNFTVQSQTESCLTPESAEPSKSSTKPPSASVSQSDSVHQSHFQGTQSDSAKIQQRAKYTISVHTSPKCPCPCVNGKLGMNKPSPETRDSATGRSKDSLSSVMCPQKNKEPATHGPGDKSRERLANPPGGRRCTQCTSPKCPRCSANCPNWPKEYSMQRCSQCTSPKCPKCSANCPNWPKEDSMQRCSQCTSPKCPRCSANCPKWPKDSAHPKKDLMQKCSQCTSPKCPKCSPNCPNWPKNASKSAKSGISLKVQAKGVANTKPLECCSLKKFLGLKSDHNFSNSNGYTIRDCDGRTLVERKDYTVHRNAASEVTIPLLGSIYGSKVKEFTTTNVYEMESAEKTKEVEKSKSDSDTSIANTIEIDFKLKVKNRDKTTVINLGDDAVNEKSNRKSRDKDVFVMKNANKEVLDDPSPENDLNIHILIKNYKTKSETKKSKQAEFAENISRKFHTVSTGYSRDFKYNSEGVSIHRATIDLTTSGEKSNTLIENPDTTADVSLSEKLDEQKETKPEPLVDKIGVKRLSETLVKVLCSLNNYDDTVKPTSKHFDAKTGKAEIKELRKSSELIKSEDLHKSDTKISITGIEQDNNSLGNKTSDEPTDIGNRSSDDPSDGRSSEEPTDVGRTSDDRTDLGNKTSDEHPDVGLRTSDEPSDVGLRTSDERQDIRNRTSDEPTDEGNRTSDEPTDIGNRTSDEPTDAGNRTSDDVDNKTSEERSYSGKSSEDIDSDARIIADLQRSRKKGKKERLKQVFENVNYLKKPKTKMQKLKNILKSILTSESEIEVEHEHESVQRKNSSKVFTISLSHSTHVPIYPTADNTSGCSGNESTIDDDKKVPRGCICSTFAQRLNSAGCCCKKKVVVHDIDITCDLVNEEIVICDPDSEDSVERVDASTQNSKYKPSLPKVNVDGQPASILIKKRDSNAKVNFDSKPTSIVSKPSDSTSKIEEIISVKSMTSQNILPDTVTRVNQCEIKAVNRKTKLGISEKDQIFFMESKSTRMTQKLEKNTKKETYLSGADVLQLYETKKAVLEIYAERTVTNKGEHIVAKLPKFTYDRENELYENYDDGKSQSYRICKKNFVMMTIGR